MLTAASSGTTTPHLNSGKPPLLEPNIGAISSHLYNLFSPEFVQGYPDSWIEIAYCRPDAGLNKARNFSAFDIGGAADFAASMNRHGYNIYIGPGLRHGDKPETGRASAHHFLASRYFWAEFDGEGDDDRIAAICQEMELKPALAVTTGTTPFPRRHLYFEAAEPVTTAAEIQAGNIALKDLFGSDDVDDPSRVMRLAGTVNHPSPKKTLKGYQPEVTALHAPASPPAYSVEALCDLRPAKEQPKDDKFSEEGEGELRGLAKVRGLLESSKGVRWHIPVRAATASLIGLGFPDDVIATICAPYCAGGYEDPDLAKFIQSARKKFGRERESGQQKRFPLIPFDQIQIDTTRHRYLVKGLLANTGLTVLWGEPKCGKSFWAVDIALHIALGWPYRNRRVQQAPVVYIALEGQHGLPARIEAFRKYHNITGTIPFYLITVPVNLIADHKALVDDIKAQIGDTTPGAVFIDTLNRSLVGSESKDEDMAAYIAAGEYVASQLKTAVIVVHHCGINTDRPRGHTSLTGSVETQLAVKKSEDGVVSVKVECAKDIPEGAEIFSRLEPVFIGTDLDGDDEISMVVVPVTDTEASIARKKIGTCKDIKGQAALALRILHDLIAESIVAPPPEVSERTRARTILEKTWRLAFYDGTASEGLDRTSQQKAFVRAANKLLLLKVIGKWGEHVWLA